MDVTSAASRLADCVLDSEGDLVLAVGADSEEGEETFWSVLRQCAILGYLSLEAGCSLAHVEVETKPGTG
jgi:hypothetical protein